MTWFWGKPKPNVLVLIKEGEGGITTYISPMLFRAGEAHKRQLRAFIDQIYEQIGNGKNGRNNLG